MWASCMSQRQIYYNRFTDRFGIGYNILNAQYYVRFIKFSYRKGKI